MTLKYLPQVEHGKLCRIATGQYTGDGTLAQAITGIGFPPGFVRIGMWSNIESGAAWAQEWYKSDQHFGDLCDWHLNGSDQVKDNALISLDGDGFTVDDDGINNHPNKLGSQYWFVAWG